ncbi:hypothetical protein DYB30_009472 [Aphanomyces astaci]|uniref:Uncharacterized protein n=1 Tax=Aphanomyces astaci TaxID=112090 RepID=A0A397D1P1_APHAT|nr:hypothetical protein DYB30_009472 [Aphanomyces astaci]
MDDWERRTNSHGYTYYYHVSTGTSIVENTLRTTLSKKCWVGAMQWTAPTNDTALAAECGETSDCDDAVGVSVESSDSSNSSNDDDDNVGIGANDVAAALTEVSAAPEELHRVVLDTVVWVLREVWQSHVEIGQYVARSTRILLEAVTPPLRQLLLAQPAISQQPPPSIPVTFIPAKQSSSVVYTANNIDDDIRDEIRPELPV